METLPAFFAPVVAMVGLTLVVWLWMYATRLTTLFRSGANPQDLADDEKFDAILGAVKDPSDNFSNHFEIPILFHLGMIVAFVAGFADETYTKLGWAFVVFRALHSLVHLTSNRIRFRFATYLFASIAMWAIWFRIAIRVFA